MNKDLRSTLLDDDSLLRKFNPFCFGADLITQSDSIKYSLWNNSMKYLFNETIAHISKPLFLTEYLSIWSSGSAMWSFFGPYSSLFIRPSRLGLTYQPEYNFYSKIIKSESYFDMFSENY